VYVVCDVVYSFQVLIEMGLVAGTDAMVWTLVEPGAAIVASSLATIRPLLRSWRIKGFTTTDNTYGTGPSAAARSGVMRSKSGTVTGTMPGFGPNDVSLLNVEPKFDEARFTPGTLATAYSARNKSLPILPLSPGQQTVKSEIFVIQGHEVTSQPRWHGRAYSSPNGSIEQIHDLEAQNQDTGYGLGLIDDRKQ
jgi:hypothetical protein